MHKLLGVALQLLFLIVDFFQVCQAHGRHMAHRLQHTVAGRALAVAPGNGLRPVGRRQGLRQDRFNAVHQLADFGQKLVQGRGGG